MTLVSRIMFCGISYSEWHQNYYFLVRRTHSVALFHYCTAEDVQLTTSPCFPSFAFCNHCLTKLQYLLPTCKLTSVISYHLLSIFHTTAFSTPCSSRPSYVVLHCILSPYLGNLLVCLSFPVVVCHSATSISPTHLFRVCNYWNFTLLISHFTYHLHSLPCLMKGNLPGSLLACLIICILHRLFSSSKDGSSHAQILQVSNLLNVLFSFCG